MVEVAALVVAAPVLTLVVAPAVPLEPEAEEAGEVWVVYVSSKGSLYLQTKEK